MKALKRKNATESKRNQKPILHRPLVHDTQNPQIRGLKKIQENTIKALKRKNVTVSNRNQKTSKDDVFENLLVGAFVISSALIMVMYLVRYL